MPAPFPFCNGEGDSASPGRAAPSCDEIHVIFIDCRIHSTQVDCHQKPHEEFVEKSIQVPLAALRAIFP